MCWPLGINFSASSVAVRRCDRYCRPWSEPYTKYSLFLTFTKFLVQHFKGHNTLTVTAHWDDVLQPPSTLVWPPIKVWLYLNPTWFAFVTLWLGLLVKKSFTGIYFSLSSDHTRLMMLNYVADIIVGYQEIQHMGLTICKINSSLLKAYFQSF